MKNLKLAIAALVFTTGFGAAVLQHVQAAPKLVDPIYNWVKGTNSFSGTVSDAESHYGCSGTSTACAQGTLKPGQSGPATATIYQN